MKSLPAIAPEEAERAVASAKDLSTAFRVASEMVLPSVVAIENVPKMATANEGPTRRQPDPFGDRNPFEGTPFGDLFQDRGFEFQTPPSQPGPHAGGIGSGVIIDAAGVILTNNHVVAGDGEVTVRLHDGREFKAASVQTDPKTDIAVVRIDASGLVAAKIGDSDLVATGEWVLALGQPFGLESTVTAGIISAKHRGIGITARENFLQTDAAINPGNSGGPLVNLDSELIGINTAISSRGGGNDGIGFAVPINLAMWVGDQLANGGTVHRAYLGVGIQPVNAQLAEQLSVKPREGVAVTEVYSDTPAAIAGLKAGDVIVEYAGLKISSPQELQVAVERSKLDQPHVLKVVRDGKRMEIEFIPKEQPSKTGAGQGASETPQAESSQLKKLGLEISDLDASVAEQLGMRGVEGVVITAVRPGSPAGRAGLASGDVITQVDRQAVMSVADFTTAVQSSKADDGLLLLVRGNQSSRFVVLNP
jgi:serine protease Do